MPTETKTNKAYYILVFDHFDDENFTLGQKFWPRKLNIFVRLIVWLLVCLFECLGNIACMFVFDKQLKREKILSMDLVSFGFGIWCVCFGLSQNTGFGRSLLQIQDFFSLGWNLLTSVALNITA